MRLLLHLSVLAGKQIARHRLRTALTLAGIASGIFLFTAVETMQSSLREATEATASDTTLIVYRENRFCPSTSRLPEHYLEEIRRLPGVRDAIPVQIVVNNCGASLDIIAFRGVPPTDLPRYNPDLEVMEGSIDEWMRRDDAALLGENFARRRGLQPGDQFEAVGVRVHVAGIVRSPLAQDNNVAYVHLPFLQQASRSGLGAVTQFNVRVESADLLDSVAARIDEVFATDAEPTDTRPEKAFFAQTGKDLIEIIGFTRWLGVGAVFAVLGLVANSLLLVARGRIKESAILQTLGFRTGSIGVMMLWEGLLLGFAGGVIGSVSAGLFFHWKRFTFGSEGVTLALNPSLPVIGTGLALAMVLGVLAALWPARIASRHPIVSSLRNA
ncbi:MAG: ABC transporter permease [Verrucomicrobiales bacterium]|nr:ABC transporter permease [Verrucomicrobiales bacterium]